MENIKKNNELKLFLALFVFLLFSSDRNLLVSHYILGGRLNIWIFSIFSILVLAFFLFSKVSLRKTLIIRKSQKELIIFSIILSFYFLFHEVIFGDGLVSMKYSIYLGILILCLSIRQNFFYVFQILGYLGALICFLVILQQILLLTFANGNLNEFQIAIEGNLWGRVNTCDYVQPFGIGLMERCSTAQDIYIGNYIINRSIFFATEPKYIASILLVTFSSLLISKKKSYFDNFCVILYAMAFLFIWSASALLILIFSIFMVYFNFIGPKLYTTVIFLFPIFILPLLINFLLQLLGIDGFLFSRLASAEDSIGSGEFIKLSLFGESFGASCFGQICADQGDGLVSNLTTTYGLIGFSLFWIFFYLVTLPVFKIKKYKEIDFTKIFGLIILMNTYVVFNIYFFSDMFNMYGLFIILTIILFPEYLESKKFIDLEKS